MLYVTFFLFSLVWMILTLFIKRSCLTKVAKCSQLNSPVRAYVRFISSLYVGLWKLLLFGKYHWVSLKHPKLRKYKIWFWFSLQVFTSKAYCSTLVSVILIEINKEDINISKLAPIRIMREYNVIIMLTKNLCSISMDNFLLDYVIITLPHAALPKKMGNFELLCWRYFNDFIKAIYLVSLYSKRILFCSPDFVSLEMYSSWGQG